MSEITQEPPRLASTGWRLGHVLLALLPLLGLGIVIALIVMTGAGLTPSNLPPFEELTIQRIVLPEPGHMRVELVNGGPDPVTVAQVLVDDAFWQFTMEPQQTVPRLGQATIHLAYPWVEGEAHAVRLLTSTGVTFDGEVPLAVATPGFSWELFLRYALLGFYVGVVPVALGLAWHPFLRQMGRTGLNVILSLTVGLLVFLFIDTLLEALEVAATLPGAFSGQPLVWMLTLLTTLALLAVGGRRGDRSRLAVATMIAFGIGLHNLGEGLAIGAALAAGEAALGTFLVIGFTLHNITEGIGIAAPLAQERPPLRQFIALGALAGAPAILGTWIGGFAYSPLLTTVFMAIGAGAILQVIWEVGRMLVRDAQRHQEPLVSWPTFAGLTLGIAIMYATALLVTV
ncbi:MAG: ZIP family metal transporter [Ardenticatenales bacterium]|nr:ZIP family metal transporter [Ardenticatenales bacterium]